jgi:hypothetical protein
LHLISRQWTKGFTRSLATWPVKQHEWVRFVLNLPGMLFLFLIYIQVLASFWYARSCVSSLGRSHWARWNKRKEQPCE